MMNQILIEQVKQDLRTLRLNDMAEGLEAALEQAQKEQQGYLSFLAQLVQKQLEAVRKRSLERRIHKGNFPRNMTFESYDWHFQPSLNVEYVKDLAQLEFIFKRQPVLILGKTGAGKTHLATAFGIRACEAGLRVQFATLQELLSKLYATLADETTDELISSLSRLDLLIIDGAGYIRTKPQYPSLLFDLICACQDRVSVIVTSHISFEQWGSVLGNPSITNAIVDRLFHQAHVINIRPGRSYRTQGPDAPKLPPTNNPSPQS
jgi:DNA replication protein DnaC